MTQSKRTSEKQNAKSASTTDAKTQGLPSDLDIDQLIKARRDELYGIHGTMAVLLALPVPSHKKSKIGELQDRLEFRVKQYELKLLEEKVDIFGQVLKVLKNP